MRICVIVVITTILGCIPTMGPPSRKTATSQRSNAEHSAGESCTFSSDCGEGRTCRSNTCMGLGEPGDPCVFSSDCLSDSCDGSEKICR
ncbi:MAG: hypothetical protein AB7O24_07040 [Kofleriaceae bacterium]